MSPIICFNFALIYIISCAKILIKYLPKFVELCFELYYVQIAAHTLAILYGNFRLYWVNGSICLRKYKTINYSHFLLRTCVTQLYFVQYGLSLILYDDIHLTAVRSGMMIFIIQTHNRNLNPNPNPFGSKNAYCALKNDFTSVIRECKTRMRLLNNIL